MFTPDFSKMFDPTQLSQTYTQNMQKWFDWSNTMSASQSNMQYNLECMKQVSSILTDTIATCSEKQFKYAQSTMEDCIESMRQLSTTKGIEEYVSKQSEIAKRSAEKAQSCAQDIANTWQKSQAKCTDIISQQMSQTMEWSKSATGATTKSTSTKQ